VGRCLALGRVAVLVLAATGAISCGSDDLGTRTFPDVGRFCVASDDDGGVTFSVIVGLDYPSLDSCHGSASSCRATLSGRRIELRSFLEIRELPGVVECPAESGASRATCALEGLPAGEYQFGFASRVDTATLPFEGSIPLFGDHECDPMVLTLPNPYPSPPGPMGPVPEFGGQREDSGIPNPFR
jgi:hypothetical protein